MGRGACARAHASISPHLRLPWLRFAGPACAVEEERVAIRVRLHDADMLVLMLRLRLRRRLELVHCLPREVRHLDRQTALWHSTSVQGAGRGFQAHADCALHLRCARLHTRASPAGTRATQTLRGDRHRILRNRPSCGFSLVRLLCVSS
jgi:hypothetical protein